jgi:hypothetical protein
MSEPLKLSYPLDFAVAEITTGAVVGLFQHPDSAQLYISHSLRAVDFEVRYLGAEGQRVILTKEYS